MASHGKLWFNPAMMATLPKSLLAPLALLFAVSACTSAPKVSAAGDEGWPSPIIDAHTHTGFPDKPEWAQSVPVTEERYFREMREAGVTGAVAHGFADGSGYADYRSRNVVHCAGAGAKVDAARIEAGLKSREYGCIKVYLGYEYQWAYDRHYEPVYRLAEKYGVPVVFHTGDTYLGKGKLKFADPLTIDEVAVDHPKVNFVIAHCGNPWILSAAEVAYKNANVYLECSAMLTGDLSKLPPEQVEEYLVKPLAWIFGYVDKPAKLMFGSDWPLTNMKSYVEAYKRAIPKEHWNAVFHDNAARLFKLD